MTFFKRTLLLTAAATLMMVGTANATSMTYDFYQLTDNGNTDVSDQLSVEVIDNGDGTVTFTFTNTSEIDSSITDIYFDDGTLLGISTIESSTGVSFSDPATPSNLPGGNLADPAFVTTQFFSADSDTPILANGVNSSSEWVSITFDLIDGQTYDDTIAALADGSLRIGLHVQGIDGGGSDSYVNLPNEGDIGVPDGGMTISLLGLAFAGLGWIARRKS